MTYAIFIYNFSSSATSLVSAGVDSAATKKSPKSLKELEVGASSIICMLPDADKYPRTVMLPDSGNFSFGLRKMLLFVLNPTKRQLSPNLELSHFVNVFLIKSVGSVMLGLLEPNFSIAD